MGLILSHSEVRKLNLGGDVILEENTVLFLLHLHFEIACECFSYFHFELNISYIFCSVEENTLLLSCTGQQGIL